MTDPLAFTQDLVQTDPWPIPRKTFIIGEIGINHNGDLDIAKRLIAMAHRCGCDAVKFQKRTIDIVYDAQTLAAPRESPWGTTQRQQKEALEFGEAEYDAIDAYCRDLGMTWFASAWDIPSQHFLKRYDLKFNKIASAMATHADFVADVAAEGKPTFISTGMCEMDEIDAVVGVFRARNCPFVLLHTVSEYPCPEDSLNLSMMATLRQRYGCPVGYSGHEPSVSPTVMAAVMGAMVIERHITLDRTMYGSDQAASLEEPGLTSVVTQIRKVPHVVGDGAKHISATERGVAKKLRYWTT